MAGGFQEDLAKAAMDCFRTAEVWKAQLSEGDKGSLIRAFHRAEALAEFALVEAIMQVPEEHGKDLARQRVEEERHVDVFAGFLGGAVDIPPRPKSKVRPPSVWYGLLLLNELTGYCQFSMLAALLEPSERFVLETVIAEEEEHVERLLRWMEPVWESRECQQATRMVQRFRADLPGRMEQFFEGPHLEGLRQEMGGHVRVLLDGLLERFTS
jgi:hypothetical protein